MAGEPETGDTLPRGAPLLVALAVAPALLGLGNEIHDADPAQYADVARRMLERGDWLHLRDLNGPFINKPPLMMWAQAASMAVLGADSVAARLPALLFGLAAVLGTFLAGRELKGPRLGAVAAALFGGSVAFHHMVADPKVDMPLTAMSTLAVWALLASRRRPRFAWLAWLFGALAMLSKGPVGLALPVLAVAPELLRAGWHPAPTSFARRVLSVRPVTGLLIVAALTAPFYVATAEQGGAEAAGYLLWGQGFGRLVGQSGYKDTTTPLFFVHTSLWAFLPLTPLLAAALVRRVGRAWRTRALPADAGRVPLWWLALPFAVISLSDYKLPQYVYWLGPPAALLAAQEVLALGEAARRRWHVGFSVVAALAFALGVLVLVAGFPPGAAWTAAWVGVLAGVPAALWAATRRWEPALRTTALALGATAGFLAYFHGGLHPALLEYQPGRELGALARARDPSGAELPVYETPRPSSTAFYARRDLPQMQPHEIVDAVRAGRTRLALIGDGRADELRAAGLEVARLARLPSYPTSMPRGRFLRASTREGTLKWVELVEVSVPAPK